MNEVLDDNNDQNAQFVAPVTGSGETSYEFRRILSDPSEGVLTEGESLSRFESMLDQAETLAFITDLDGTVLPFAANPMDCRIDPKAHTALQRIEKSGISIFVMTGRSGADGAKMIDMPSAVIVGTSGWEVYQNGVSRVHERFDPYAAELKTLLQKIRETVVAKMGLEPNQFITEEITNELSSEAGPIVLERKAVNDIYPEGLSQTYNLNRFDPARWDELMESSQSVFDSEASDQLKEIFKFDGSVDREKGTAGFSIAPFSGEGKERSLLQVLRSDQDEDFTTGQPKRQKYFRGLPGGFDGAVYFGDSDQDARALRAAHLTALLAGRHSAGVVVFKTETNGAGQTRALKAADVSVDDIQGNAELLTKLADICEQKRPASET